MSNELVTNNISPSNIISGTIQQPYGFTSGGCVTTTWPQTQTVYVQGDAVTIQVIETFYGFKGQIVMKVASQNVIVWESDAYDKDDFLPIESADGKVGKTPEARARQAAQEAAEARAEAVLRKLFEGVS